MAAQDYFNSFSPAEQQRIRNSWGGQDLLQEWFQNAVNAGAVAGQRTQGVPTATDATTGSTPQGYMNTGTSPFADMIRARARAEGWSEDFARFSDAQIEAWKQYWDPAAGRFRSENDPTGAATYDKPAECPPGTTFHGTRCVKWEDLPAWAGGGVQQQPLTQAAMGWQQPQQGPQAAPVGGAWGELGGQSRQDLSALLQPYLAQPTQAATSMPLQSATQGLIAPLGGTRMQTAGIPTQLGTGWSVGQDNLTKMMAQRQRRPGQFGGAAGSWWA